MTVDTEMTKKKTPPGSSSDRGIWREHWRTGLFVFLFIGGTIFQLRSYRCLERIFNQTGPQQQQWKIVSSSSSSSSATKDGAAISGPPMVESSQGYISKMGIDHCRFTTNYDDSSYYFPLKSGNSYIGQGTWRSAAKLDRGADDGATTERRIQHRLRSQRHEQREYPDLPKPKRNMTFVHIGKAGGSTITCALGIPSDHCNEDDARENNVTLANSTAVDSTSADDSEEYDIGALTHNVICSTHWAWDLKCYFNDYIENLAFLVNVRNPLDRMASWFIYEHSENHNVVYDDRDHHCGQLILNSCYRNWEDMITIGLSGPRPHTTQPLRVGWDLTATECSHWAWAAVQGNIPADYHNSFNYDWYAHYMFLEKNHDGTAKEIYVLRVEHLEQDWSTVDRLMGGTGAIPSALLANKNTAAKKPLQVKNSMKNTTAIGIQNLCRALCHEIQAYKTILRKSVNLNSADLEVSMAELRQRCPEEADINSWTCRDDDKEIAN